MQERGGGASPAIRASRQGSRSARGVKKSTATVVKEHRDSTHACRRCCECSHGRTGGTSNFRLAFDAAVSKRDAALASFPEGIHAALATAQATLAAAILNHSWFPIGYTPLLVIFLLSSINRCILSDIVRIERPFPRDSRSRRLLPNFGDRPFLYGT
jgi:hypothetical protein